MPYLTTKIGVVRVSIKTDDEALLVRLGKAIREARKELGQSQEALADAAQIDRSHMGKIERGERNVTFLNIHRIATALGCSAAELMMRASL